MAQESRDRPSDYATTLALSQTSDRAFHGLALVLPSNSALSSLQDVSWHIMAVILVRASIPSEKDQARKPPLASLNLWPAREHPSRVATQHAHTMILCSSDFFGFGLLKRQIRCEWRSEVHGFLREHSAFRGPGDSASLDHQS